MERKGIYTIRSLKRTDDTCVKMKLSVSPEDKNVLPIQQGDLIENISAQPKITIRNSVFRNSNSHLRFQSRGTILVEDCTFGLPILLTGDTNYWYESSPVADITIRNCRFLTEKAQIQIIPEFTPTEKAPYYHQLVRIENNLFVSSNPVQGHHAAYISFHENTSADGRPFQLSLQNCGVIDMDSKY